MTDKIKFGPLDLRHWGTRYKRNYAPFGFYYNGVQHVIREGFQSDLASIPNLVRGLMDDLTDRPAFVHDFHCRLKRWSDTDASAITRLEADKFFRLGCRHEGVRWARAQALYLGVRVQAYYRGQR